MNIWKLLEQANEQYPERLAVIDGSTRLTYSDVHRRVSSLASYMSSQGIGKGDRISIIDFNSLPFFETYFAAAGLGAILNPINYRLAAEEIVYILKDTGSLLLLISSSFEHQVDRIIEADTAVEGIIRIGEIPAPTTAIPTVDYREILGHSPVFNPVHIEPDDVAHLYYTSGTTGKPKGVILTHRNVCVHARGAVEELNLGETDRWGHIAPMFHLADAWAVFAVTMVGGCHIMSPKFEEETVLEMIQRERVTISNLIPTMLNLMVKRPDIGKYDLSSLRMILSGGAPIAADVVRRIIDSFGCEYVQTYGMTETSPYLTLSLLKEHLKILSPEEQLVYRAKTGRTFATVELKVVRDDGTPVVQDNREVGEIWAKGETITPGYWNNPGETESAFCDGWLKTGDLAVIDSEGYLNIVDRKKDMIICGGENVYSVEVENVLYKHSKVLEAAVFGVPDEIWGETVKAAVVLKPGEEADACEIVEFCNEHIAQFKAPRSIVFLSELPKTGSGKIYKQALKERYGTG